MILNQLFNCKDELSTSVSSYLRNKYYKKVFGKYGENIKFANPMMIVNPKHIYIGDNVVIRSGIRLECIVKWKSRKYNPSLKIGKNVIIEQNCHISCASSIEIKDNVLISSYAFITDLNHEYSQINEPIMKQGLIVKKTLIQENSFIGTGAKIMAGVTIGKHCIIGANSVVTKDIPDYSVVAGAPAKIIKCYNSETKEWLKVREL